MFKFCMSAGFSFSTLHFDTWLKALHLAVVMIANIRCSRGQCALEFISVHSLKHYSQQCCALPVITRWVHNVRSINLSGGKVFSNITIFPHFRNWEIGFLICSYHCPSNIIIQIVDWHWQWSHHICPSVRE